MGGDGVAAVRTRESSCEDERRSMQREVYRYQGDYTGCMHCAAKAADPCNTCDVPLKAA